MRLHIVQPSETLEIIAERYGLTVEALREANGLKGDAIEPGVKLTLPEPNTPQSDNRGVKQASKTSFRLMPPTFHRPNWFGDAAPAIESGASAEPVQGEALPVGERPAGGGTVKTPAVSGKNGVEEASPATGETDAAKAEGKAKQAVSKTPPSVFPGEWTAYTYPPAPPVLDPLFGMPPLPIAPMRRAAVPPPAPSPLPPSDRPMRFLNDRPPALPTGSPMMPPPPAGAPWPWRTNAPCAPYPPYLLPVVPVAYPLPGVPMPPFPWIFGPPQAAPAPAAPAAKRTDRRAKAVDPEGLRKPAAHAYANAPTGFNVETWVDSGEPDDGTDVEDAK